jgi:uncharacterized protein (UPF0548 family)
MFELLDQRLRRYDIFPPRLMRAEICSGDGLVHDGTTIVQRVRVGPIRLEAGVRVLRVWRHRDGDAEESGFTYATLRGHPERGVSTFRIRRRLDRDDIAFLIDVRSRPGTLLTRLTRPLARRFQRRATDAALDHVSRPIPVR